ncbi:MAG: hypothetical protein ABSH03_16090 [Candidatus Lustribacter sp.]|jgi:hypothetical protein
MDTLCHTREEIERLALRLPCVPTDNREALVALGFERLYPQAVSGYDSHLWTRSVDSGHNAGASGNARKLIVQRAFLDGSSPRRRAATAGSLEAIGC